MKKTIFSLHPNGLNQTEYRPEEFPEGTVFMAQGFPEPQRPVSIGEFASPDSAIGHAREFFYKNGCSVNVLAKFPF